MTDSEPHVFVHSFHEWNKLKFNEVKEKFYFSLVPSESHIPFHNDWNLDANIFVGALIQEVQQHYHYILCKWREKERSRIFSSVRKRMIEPSIFPRKRRSVLETKDENYSDDEMECTDHGMIPESLAVELDVIEMILTFLAGESEWLRIAASCDPYAPRTNYYKYYTDVARDFTSGHILNRIKIDETVFRMAHDCSTWEQHENKFPPFFPTSTPPQTMGEEVFDMEL